MALRERQKTSTSKEWFSMLSKTCCHSLCLSIGFGNISQSAAGKGNLRKLSP